jgi:hypothetical protein
MSGDKTEDVDRITRDLLDQAMNKANNINSKSLNGLVKLHSKLISSKLDANRFLQRDSRGVILNDSKTSKGYDLHIIILNLN